MELTCEQTRRYLLAHLDDELDAKTSFDVQRHLEECAGCAAEAKAVARESEQLARALAPEDKPTNELERRIELALIEAERAERRASRRAYFRSGIALAAGVVLAIGLYFSLGRPVALHAAGFGAQHKHCIHEILAGEDDHGRTGRERRIDRAHVPEPMQQQIEVAGWIIRNAHKCRIGGRAFYHVILGDGRVTASVFFALESAPEDLAAAFAGQAGGDAIIELVSPESGRVIVVPNDTPRQQLGALRAALAR